MIDIKIDNNHSLFNDFLQAFPEKADKSVRIAINRAKNGVLTDLSSAIPKEYNIKPGKVRKYARVWDSQRGAVISISGPPLSLVNFTRAQVTNRRPTGGVSVRVKNERKLVKGSFVARMHNGQVHLFKRVGEDRLPIKKLTTLSIPQMVSSSVVLEVQKGANSRFFKSFNHEFNRFLNRK